MAETVVLGEALIDLFAEPGVGLAAAPAFRPSPGGAPANVAVAVARLGGDVAFVGRVGDDPFGQHLRETLAGYGVGVDHLGLVPGAPTMLAVVATPTPQRPEFVLYGGAAERLGAEELPRELIERAGLLVYGSVTLAGGAAPAARAAAEIARSAGTRILFDVNLRPTLWTDLDAALGAIAPAATSADLLKLNVEELRFLTGSDGLDRGVAALLDAGVGLCCVTLGAEGCLLAHADASVRVPGFAVEAVDPTGAGDAFVAALAHRLAGFAGPLSTLDRETLHEIGRYANACGALVATQVGAMRAELTPARVAALLAR